MNVESKGQQLEYSLRILRNPLALDCVQTEEEAGEALPIRKPQEFGVNQE